MNPTTTPTASSTILSTSALIRIALVTAVTCILAPLSIPIPFSPVPLSLTNLVLYISIFILGWKSAAVSYLVYLLLGIVGLPVFSGFSGGLGKLAGPTGGYLAGMIFLTVISGWFIERFPKSILLKSAGMILGSAANYLFGTLWLSYQLHISFAEGLLAGVVPYLAFDLMKIVIALSVGPAIQKRLQSM